jgi:hypothetical protein
VRVALLFIDGVGIGAKSPAVNPLARAPYLLSQFEDGTGELLPHGGKLYAVDATFGVPGRPQSATNQTAMLTGEPAPALLGRHVLGFPNHPLRRLLAERSIIRRMAERGLTAEFANCYPAGYLDALGLTHRPSRAPDVQIPAKAKRRLRPSATTCAFAAADVPLRTLDDARAGHGLTNDIRGHRGRAHGFDIPERSCEEAAAVFWRIAARADFTLFEHYLADEAGHAKDDVGAADALATFDAFARAVIAQRPPDVLTLVCSDHGNVEDLSTRNHTLARVPVLVFGADVGGFANQPTVANVARVICAALDCPLP